MENPQINFKQERDFGEVFNSTFTFLSQEIKPLAKALLYFVAPVLLIAAIITIIVSVKQQEFMKTFSAGLNYESNPFEGIGRLYMYLFFTMLINLVALSALRCTIYGYIKAYVDKGKGQFTLDDVWAEVKRFILPVTGTTLLISLLVGFGFAACLAPGIWLGVSLSLIYFAMIYEGKGMGEAFSRSFSLVKTNWWVTLAIILVSYLLVYVLSVILSIPQLILGMKSFFSVFRDLESAGDMQFSLSYYIVSSIISVFTYVLFTIPAVALAFQYFSQREIMEKTSLGDKIEQIG